MDAYLAIETCLKVIHSQTLFWYVLFFEKKKVKPRLIHELPNPWVALHPDTHNLGGKVANGN